MQKYHIRIGVIKSLNSLVIHEFPKVQANQVLQEDPAMNVKMELHY